ncbi:hypothetical protein ACOMHN_065192 [Nucella lapillus]
MSASVVNKGLIGKGAFGWVYLVENSAGEEFAIKLMEWQRAGPRDRGVVVNELRVLQSLSHQHILSYVDHFQQDGIIFIITEYCSGGDLTGFLHQVRASLPEDLLLVWLWQMACGLEFMHTHENGPVLHRDLKPSNVFFSEKGDVRLGDMGIARKLDHADAMAETFCGTPQYMSPEVLKEKPYNSKTDIWSLGCCVTEMATLEKTYKFSSLHLLRNAVMKMREPLPGQYSKALDDLVSRMLVPEFQDRISAKQVLDDSILQGYEDVEPMKLIEKYGLRNALTIHRPASPSTASLTPPSTLHTTSTTTTTSGYASGSGPPTFIGKDNESVHSLTDSMANLAVILGEGEPITTYRIKIERRVRGRRQADDTITNANVQTVLYRPERAAQPKTTKKMMKVPSVVEAEPDDSLSQAVLSSMNTSITLIGQSRRGQEARSTATAPVQGAGTDDSSCLSQVDMLRRSLVQLIGMESLSEASTIVATATDEEQLRSGLASLVGENQTLLDDCLIYLSLIESVRDQSSPSV